MSQTNYLNPNNTAPLHCWYYGDFKRIIGEQKVLYLRKFHMKYKQNQTYVSLLQLSQLLSLNSYIYNIVIHITEFSPNYCSSKSIWPGKNKDMCIHIFINQWCAYIKFCTVLSNIKPDITHCNFSSNMLWWSNRNINDIIVTNSVPSYPISKLLCHFEL